jgi:DNA polymerase III subunit delta
MADMKPAYLVHGDDDVKLDDWRARVRTRVAEDEGADLEWLRDDRLSGQAIVDALGLLTLGVGRRWIVADGVQDWKEKDVAAVAAALKTIDPETVVIFIAQANPKARRGSPARKGQAPATLAEAVEKTGGEVHACAAPKPRGLPKWVLERSKELNLNLERDAAEALVELVGLDDGRPRLRRLLRELEKLALFADEGAVIDRETVEAVASPDVQARVHELADAVIEGNRERALILAEELRVQGEPVTYVIFGLLRKALEVRGVWGPLESGLTYKQIAAAMKVPDWMVKRIAEQAARTDGERLERTVHELAELDWAVRGGGSVAEEPALTLAVDRAAA